MKVRDIYERLDKMAPFKSALDWDNVGLICGDMEKDIQKVLIALDADDTVIDTAVSEGCQLILTHHPFIFSSIKRIVATDMMGSRILKAISHGISIMSMHTNFDVHVMGEIVAKRLGLNSYEVLDVTEEESGKGIGTVSQTEETTMEELSQKVKTKFNLPFVAYYGPKDQKVNRIAIVPGAGSSEIELAIQKGADTLITGDIDYHNGCDAKSRGLFVIDAGHYGLEHIFIDYMETYFKEHIPEIKAVGMKTVFPRSVV